MADADQLAEIYNALDADRQQALFEFAKFLSSQCQASPAISVIGKPLDIPRPDNETVVGAIKRLKQTYPMIDSMSVFSSASSLMTEHMVQGRDAREVIDEMQQLFHKAYEELLQND